MNSTAARPLEARRIIYDCDTIEDYLNVATPPVGQDVRHAFSVVQRPRSPDEKDKADLDGRDSVVELVSARFDAQRNKHILVHVHPTKGETGWICDEIELDQTRREDGSPVPVRPVSRIEAFYQSSKDQNGKSVHAIYALLHFQHEDDENYYFVMAMQFIEGVGWQQWDLSDRSQRHVRNHLVKNRQTAVYRDNYGKHAFYGVSKAGVDERFFIIFQTTKGLWKAVTKSVKGEGRSTFRIVAPHDSWDPKKWTEGLLRIEGREVFLAELSFGRSLVIGNEEQILNSEDDLSAANIIPLPTRSEARGFLLHSPATNHLYYITNHQGDRSDLTKLTGNPSGPKTLEQITIGRTRTDQVIIFAVSQADHRLWVLRQTGTGPDNTAQFGDWVCLGEQIRVLGCPRAMLDGPELFFVDMKRKLKHMSQAEKTTLWNAQTIAVPKPSDISPERTVCHAVRITALDENDLPVRNTRLQLRASHPCVVLINDFAVHIDPLRAIEFYTDRFGTARLRLPASTLSAPTLYVSLDDGSPVTAINPSERVMTRLKNKKIREKTLKAANLIPKDLDKQSSDKIAKLYRHIAEVGDEPDETNDQGGCVRTHVFETSGAAMNATFDSVAGEITTMADHETGVALWTAKKSPAIPILGDFLLQLRNGLVSVARFVVNFVKKTGQIVLEFAIGKLKVSLEFLAQKSVEAIEAVVNTLGELFRKIGKAIEDLTYKVLDWVAGVLGWDDIIRTNDAIKLFAFDMLDGLSEFFDQKAVAWNRALVNKIGALLDMAEDEVRTLCEQFCVMSGGMLDPAGRTTSESMINDKLQSDPVIVNTAFDALGIVFQWIEDRGNELLDMITPDDPDFKAFIDNFRNLLEGIKKNAMENIIEPAGKAYDNLLRSQQFNNPLMFIQAFPDIFGVLKGAIKFAVNTGGEIVEFVLKSIAIAVRLLKRLFDVKLDFIPFISEAYRRFHPDNEPLRLLDLFTLIMAIPATLIHKLIVGRAPVSEKLMTNIRNESDISWKGTVGAGIVVALSDKTMERHLAEQQSVGAMAATLENDALDIAKLQQRVIKPGRKQSEASLKNAIEIVDAVDTVFGLGKIIFSKIETDLLQVKSVDSFEPEGTPGALAYLVPERKVAVFPVSPAAN